MYSTKLLNLKVTLETHVANFSIPLTFRKYFIAILYCWGRDKYVDLLKKITVDIWWESKILITKKL